MSMISQDGIKSKCPFIKEPFEECYCSHMNSRMTEKVIKFCLGNFEACEIYKRHVKEGGKADA